MKMSCNGCRVLRKGCGDNCSIRPCLQWIKSSESQANATVFLAKFYGRAGLMNLINAGPEQLRPAIFKSLLYEACGRIVNPIYGTVGLLWTGNWPLCQAAVEAVLMGRPIPQMPTEMAASTQPPPKGYDIRHVSKDLAAAQAAAAELHKVNKPRSQFKRPGTKHTARPAAAPLLPDFNRAGSHESAASRSTEPGPSAVAAMRDVREIESMSSADISEEVSHVSQGEPEEDYDVGLELTLGYETAFRPARPSRPEAEARFNLDLAL
ncbi:LOB domain-containing protein 41-like [Canna indica]|uniref:LOB domain-containing protein 41-like n=1 Tax=Canna indica TaxID=4628 RepID=A0AAQ3QQ85_9LILI|nr:LOB domain-containing protein 41-like [Canna indica]